MSELVEMDWSGLFLRGQRTERERALFISSLRCFAPFPALEISALWTNDVKELR